MNKQLLLFTLLLTSALGVRAAYLPVAVTGYNADVVANGAGPATGSITQDFDGAGYALMASTFNPSGTIFPTRFMPNGGVINSAATSGVVYNLASYSSNNSLRITANNTDSLVFPTPASASEVFVLASTGSGASTVAMTVNFTDNTSQSFTQTVGDWYGGLNFAIQGLGRTNINTTLNGIDNNTLDPRLYEYKLVLTAANSAKSIRSVKFEKSGLTTTVLNVMGITINSPAAPSCVAAPTAPANAASVCAGSVTLSWPAASGASGYDVYLNTGTSATTIVSTNQSATTYTTTLAAGSYSWKIVPQNPNGLATGCSNFTFTVNPSVTPSVAVAAVPAGSICQGSSVTFTATPTNGGSAPTYQWKKGTTNVGTNAPTYTNAAPVTGDVITVVMTSNATCVSPTTATSAAITMTVLPRPQPVITAASDTTFCQGGSVVLNAPTGTGLTYTWLLNNAGIAGANSASYTANASGAYRVLVSNGVCADTSAPMTVTVNPLPTAVVNPAGPLVICQGTSTTLSVAPVAGFTYQWMNGTTVLTGETNPALAVTAAGSYSVTVTATGCSATSTPVTVTTNPAPGATATASSAVNFCQGGSVLLSAGPATAGYTYQWLSNNVIIPGATTRFYTATTSGAYRVRVVRTSTGCYDTSANAINVVVSTPPSTTVTQNLTSPICQGNTITFQSQNPFTYSFQWYKDGAPIPGATFQNYGATTTGAYHVVVTNGTCTATSTARSVVVNPLPTVSATASGAIAFCQGGSVQLDGNVAAGYTYQWRRNNVVIPGANAASYTANQSGFYTLTVTNTQGCSATSAPGINVQVSTMPAAAITPQGAPTFCQGNSLTLSATPGFGYTYQWELNGASIPGAIASTFSANSSGDYTVTITNGTCVATSAPYTVSVTPAPPAAITAAGPTAFCQGGSVMLDANRGANLTYQWTLNGVDIPGATTAQYKAVLAGTYGLKLSDGTCPATATPVAVRVNQLPAAVITVTGGNQLSTGAYDSYQWYRNGVAIAGATGQSYTATTNGFYAVVVADDLGCSATSSVQQVSSLSIGAAPANALVKVYPNPADGIVMVEAGVPTDLSITTIDGRELFAAQSAAQVNISQLPQGLYLIRVWNHRTGELLTLQKIIRK